MKTFVKTFYAHERDDGNRTIIVRAENQVNEFLNEDGKIRELKDMKVHYSNKYPYVDIITISYIEKEYH